jgi:hypothetical protein
LFVVCTLSIAIGVPSAAMAGRLLTKQLINKEIMDEKDKPG